MTILLNVLGIFVILGILYLMSPNKNDINKKMILKAFAIQLVLAFILVKFPLGQAILEKISDFVTQVLSYGTEGLKFVFGDKLTDGSVFGVSVLCNIIFVSALFSGLYYLGIIGFVVKLIGGVIGKVLGTSKVESFVAVANMFLGQTESPILVSKYLGGMNKSEMMLVLVSGMGSMSATVLLGYAGMGIPMKYLLIGGALVPLGSIIVSKILLPETKEELSLREVAATNEVSMDNKGDNKNLISALSEGAMNGLNMVLGIGANLIAIIAIVALVNGALGMFGTSLEQILSYVFAPLGFLMGLPKQDVLTASQLLGSKMVLNEFVAFGQLGSIINTLDYRSALMMSISLTGFANISSMGLCISGISVFCPEKRGELSELAFRGMIGGFLVSVLSALVVGLIVAL